MVIDGDDVTVHPLDGRTLPVVGNVRQVVQIEIVHERLQGGLKLTIVVMDSIDFLLDIIAVSLDCLHHRFLRRELPHQHLHHQGTGIGEFQEMRIGKILRHNLLHQGVGNLLIQDGGISQINIADQTFFIMFHHFLLTLIIILSHQLTGMRQIEQSLELIHIGTVLFHGLHLVNQPVGNRQVFQRHQGRLHVQAGQEADS